MNRLILLARGAGGRLRRMLWPRRRGVKVMLFNWKEEILLVRNRRGRSDLWVLPGGGVGPFESPSRAACREIGEELDCLVEEIEPIAVYACLVEGKRDTIHLFKALTEDEPRPDMFELAEAQWFALDELPAHVSPATRRRIGEYRGERERDGEW